MNLVNLYGVEGQMTFIYAVNPTIKLFLDQLEKSADALEDYGISVVKVL